MAETTPVEPIISPDFFQGDVAGGLERMRLRLLDLTNRNRLLNFRHTKKSSLRIVDELPDQMFELLLDGKRMTFKAVPRPRRVRSGETASLQTGFLLPGATRSGTRDPSRIPTAAEHAASLGINMSFDLPAPPADGVAPPDSRHQDRDIQTLHYPEELESILRSISSAARLAIEETGTNMLYLAFGFLEWYESEDSQQEKYAPLLLLPVLIERGDPDPQTQVYRYHLQYSGEDVVANVSLQERMRRDFSLEIPDLQEEASPEQYLRRVQRVVGEREGWGVRRQVTLSLLSFGKLLMYRDLDSCNWPRERGPVGHPRIREFFLGAERGELGVATEYRLDSPALKDLVPPIIDDADSSQHSALLDAMSGKNLVIQGPPGTGKSQTITNLIAAAIAKGKTVLFVSEKLAALEVVRHRLDRVGLGHFCLELHSHKTQKKALIQDIGARLARCRTFPSPAVLDDKLVALEHHKELLTRYVDLVNEGFGRLDQSVYEILWTCRRRRTKLQFDAELVDNLHISDAAEVTFSELERRRHLVVAYAQHLSGVLQPTGKLQEHPWVGVENTSLSFLDERKLVEQLENIRHYSEDLGEAVRRLNELQPHEVLATGEDLLRFAQGVLRVAASEQILAELLPLLRKEDIRVRLRGFGERLGAFRALHQGLVQEVGGIPSVSDQSAPGLTGVAYDAAAHLLSTQTVGELRGRAGLLESAGRSLAGARVSAEEAARWLGVTVPLTPSTLPGIQTALDLVSSAPLDVLHLRHPGLEDETARPTIESAMHEARAARDKRDALRAELQLELVPSLAEVRAHAGTMANARWWSFLSPSYRAAKRAYRVMSTAREKISTQTIRDGFQRLAVCLSEVERINANPNYRQVSGAHFNGIDTPFEQLYELSKWRGSIRKDLVFTSVVGQELGSALWSSPSDRLRGLAESLQRHPELSEALSSASACLAHLPTLLLSNLLPGSDTHLMEYAGRVFSLGERFNAGASSLESAGFGAAIRLDRIPDLVARALEHDRLLVALQQDRAVAEILGEHFAGVDTDFDRVLRTFDYYAALSRAPLPPEVVAWLLEADTAQRLDELQRVCRAANDDYARLTTAFRQYASDSRLGHGWFGTPVSLEAVSFDVIRERAERALGARDRFAEWLDFIRARAAVEAARLGDLLEPAETARLASADLPIAFEFVFSNSLARLIFRRHPELVQFSGLSHEEIRRRFVELDKEAIELQRVRAAYQIDQRPIPLGIDTGPVRNRTELGLIEREVEKQKCHVPIRQLVSRAGRALQALKPCFMMGPLSVAQYLEPGRLEFDLIIMDEASQLRPEDALGAVCRGKQVVIVGDPMQLPPTSFFDRIGDEEEEDEDETAQSLTEAESILDVASAVYRPKRMLRWHYRSRHGELIAFSNKEFYNNDLVVFPSPLAKTSELGVKFVHVSDGIYQGRKNVIEARRVVDAALKHMRARPEESLGIVALNTTQREVLENELEQRVKNAPHAQ